MVTIKTVCEQDCDKGWAGGVTALGTAEQGGRELIRDNACPQRDLLTVAEGVQFNMLDMSTGSCPGTACEHSNMGSVFVHL